MIYTIYRKQIGRVGLSVDHIGQVELTCVDGHNESCATLTNRLSVDELHDLHYMIGRALAAASARDPA